MGMQSFATFWSALKQEFQFLIFQETEEERLRKEEKWEA